MRTEELVKGLSRDLIPTRAPSVLWSVIALCVVGVVELAAFFEAGLTRSDLDHAMDTPSFWWKLASMGIIAISGVTVAAFSADPTRSARVGLRWLAICIAALFAVGWFADPMDDSFSELPKRLDWTMGIQCTWKMVVLSVPCVVALGILIRRGAPTDRFGTSLAASLGSAGWGAFIFVFACPSDDIFYIAVWYTVGCSIVTLLGRSILARLFRW